MLKEQIVVLQEKCSRVAASYVPSPSPESVASSICGVIQDPSTGESPSTTTLTTEEINKLPKDLKQFYEQMKTGKYSSEIYSKCSTVVQKVHLRSESVYLSTILVELINISKITKESPQHGYTTMCEVNDVD